MKITIEPTGLFEVVEGAICRVWEGITESGTRCDVYVARVRVLAVLDQSEFEAELMEVKV